MNFQCRFENEDVAVDGRSLIFSDFATTGSLYVYDVRDEANPKLARRAAERGHAHRDLRARLPLPVRQLQGGDDRGADVDRARSSTSSDPAQPKVLGDWTDNGVLPSRKVHDVTEIAPGLVLSASAPIQLMDVREDPVKPKVLARSRPTTSKRWHSVEWPRQGLDRFVLASFETNATPRCEAGVGDFAVFDASKAARDRQARAAQHLLPHERQRRDVERQPGGQRRARLLAALVLDPAELARRRRRRAGRLRPRREVPARRPARQHHRGRPLPRAGDERVGRVLDHVRHRLRRRLHARARHPALQGRRVGLPAGAGHVRRDGRVRRWRRRQRPAARAAGAAPARPRRRRRPASGCSAYVQALWRVRGASTQLRRLIVSRLPIATTVRVRCRGARCAPGTRRARTLTIRRARIDTERLRRLRLRAGTRFEVLITPARRAEPARRVADPRRPPAAETASALTRPRYLQAPLPGIARPLGAALAALLFLAPLSFLLTGALREPGSLGTDSFPLIGDPVSLASLERAFELVPLGRQLLNSVIVAAIAVPISVLVASWAGFGMVLLEPRARRLRRRARRCCCSWSRSPRCGCRGSSSSARSASSTRTSR